MTDRIQIKHRGTERVLYIAGAFFAVVGAAVAAGIITGTRRTGSIEPDGAMVVGLAIVAIGIWSCIAGLRLSRITPKGLTLSKTGVFDPQMMRAEIPWSNIHSAGTMQAGGRTIFALMLHRAPPEGRPFYTKIFAALNGNAGFGYRQFLFDRPIAAVTDEVTAACQRLGVAPGQSTDHPSTASPAA